jgi:hypothetical protein
MLAGEPVIRERRMLRNEVFKRLNPNDIIARYGWLMGNGDQSSSSTQLPLRVRLMMTMVTMMVIESNSTNYATTQTTSSRATVVVDDDNKKWNIVQLHL